MVDDIGETIAEGATRHETEDGARGAMDDLIESVSEVEERRMAKAANFGLLFGQLARGFRDYANRKYGLGLTLDEAEVGLSRDELLDRLRHGKPAIALARAGTTGVYINPQTLGPGEKEIILRRIVELVG